MLAPRKERFHLLLRERRGLCGIRSYKTRHPRRIPNHIPGILAHDHLNQDVPGICFLLDGLPPASLDPYLFFLRNHHVKDLVAHRERFNALLQIPRDRFFVSGIGMNGVPLPDIALSLKFFHGYAGEMFKIMMVKR